MNSSTLVLPDEASLVDLGGALKQSFKRTSGEMLGLGSAGTPGVALAPVAPMLVYATENNNEQAKKPRVDANGSPAGSRVVHIRNIPLETTEAEIIHLGIPFGRISNVLVLKGKNQAFLEFESEVNATAMVNYFGSCVAQLRGRTVYVQFSSHKQLKTNESHSNANSAARAALQAAQAFSGAGGAGVPNFMSSAVGLVGAPGSELLQQQGGPNTVLRVMVDHMIYPVTLDVLHQIFSRVGTVLKIITFTKNNTFQALIQYPDVITAQAAKLTLDGQNIYNACCTLRIEYSRLNNLNVKYNNDKSRDYTDPHLPIGGEAITGLGTAATASDFQKLAALNNMNAMLGGIPLGLPPSALSMATALGLPTPPVGQLQQANSVLLVSNLSEQEASPEGLFTLFGVYGDVHRVKILYNRKDTALIQVADGHQAQLAMTNLDRVTVWGKQIRVMPSRHQQVQMPKEGQAEDLTKDFTNSPLHRFKRPGSKNFHHIHGPSTTLHLSNIPTTTTEEQLTAAFKDNGFTVKAFKFFPNDHRMALIQLETVEEAVMALIKLHNHQLSQNNHLRVTFSKSTIHNN